MCKEAFPLEPAECFDAGVQLGYLISRMGQLEMQGHDLRERVLKLPPEQQFTFALMQTGSLAQLWRTVSPEDAVVLAAGVLEVPEEDLREDMRTAVEAARERMGDLDTL